MHIHIENDDLAQGNVKLQALIGFLVHIYDPAAGDEEMPKIPTGAAGTITTTTERAQAGDVSTSKTSATVTFTPPPPPPPPTDTSNGGDDEGDVPPPPSNVVTGNFPQAGVVPPPPPVNTAATSPTQTSTPPAPSQGALLAAAAPGVVSAEVDSAGMPYDARIHQKAKGKKKNGEWKLIKGVDENLVKSVTAELAARRGLLPQTPPATQGANTVPVPPVTNATAATGVPTPPIPPSVPVPPAPAVGSVGAVGASAYRSLIDRITTLTREGKITPQKVAEICQANGAPSLMALNGMPDLVPGVAQGIDAAALGLM